MANTGALYYTTCTIHEWQKLLDNKKYKGVIYDAFRFLTRHERCIIYSFVIMPNHLHIIWKTIPPYQIKHLHHSLLSYTAKVFLVFLDEERRSNYLVNKIDRKRQIWKTNRLSVELYSRKFIMQKMNYIHWNPYRAGLCQRKDTYVHSSYPSYKKGEPLFDFLTLLTF